MLHLIPGRTFWHISVGTYGSRLHGAAEPTVDREHNVRGTPFLPADPRRRAFESRQMRGGEVRLSSEQRVFLEQELPAICDRGRWGYVIAAAPPEPDNDHFHLLLHADAAIHGKRVREWLKRWLTEALEKRWARPDSGRWWVVGGSTKPVKDETYLRNVYRYIAKQRTSALE